jgi:hypothetical protein
MAGRRFRFSWRPVYVGFFAVSFVAADYLNGENYEYSYTIIYLVVPTML